MRRDTKIDNDFDPLTMRMMNVEGCALKVTFFLGRLLQTLQPSCSVPLLANNIDQCPPIILIQSRATQLSSQSYPQSRASGPLDHSSPRLPVLPLLLQYHPDSRSTRLHHPSHPHTSSSSSSSSHLRIFAFSRRSWSLSGLTDSQSFFEIYNINLCWTVSITHVSSPKTL